MVEGPSSLPDGPAARGHRASPTAAGSAALIKTLVENDLVDEWRLMLFPTIIGDGKRLFDGVIPRRKLQLTDDKQLGPDGIRLLTYEKAN